MSQANQKIQFDELIIEWQQLMCLDQDSTSLEDLGIAFVQEDRVLKLTEKYIGHLEGIQNELDSQASKLAERILASGSLTVDERKLLVQICERFLSSIGGSLRNQVPKKIPRADRLRARQFVIEWTAGNVQASWPEVNVSFPLVESLMFCAEHYAGADKAIGTAITRQLVSDLRAGAVSIPRLTLVSKDDSRSVYSWENATVPIGEAETAAESETSSAWSLATASPILSYFQDRVQESKIEIEKRLADEDEFDDPHVKVAAVIDRIEEGSDATTRRIYNYVDRVAAYSGGDRARALSAISSSAYWEAFEAIVAKDESVIEKRVKVVKSCNAIRESEQVQSNSQYA